MDSPAWGCHEIWQEFVMFYHQNLSSCQTCERQPRPLRFCVARNITKAPFPQTPATAAFEKRKPKPNKRPFWGARITFTCKKSAPSSGKSVTTNPDLNSCWVRVKTQIPSVPSTGCLQVWCYDLGSAQNIFHQKNHVNVRPPCSAGEGRYLTPSHQRNDCPFTI